MKNETPPFNSQRIHRVLDLPPYRPGKQGVAFRTELVGEVIDALRQSASLREVA